MTPTRSPTPAPEGYPVLIYFENDIEVILSSPGRYRLLRGNELVATFTNCHAVCSYLVSEFCQEIDLADL